MAFPMALLTALAAALLLAWSVRSINRAPEPRAGPIDGSVWPETSDPPNLCSLRACVRDLHPSDKLGHHHGRGSRPGPHR